MGLVKVPLYYRKARVIRAIDGDTVEMTVDNGYYTTVGGKYATFRLYGIDAPELHAASAVARARAMKAKARLAELVEGKEVLIRTRKDPGDKYGRFLVDIWLIAREDAHTVTPVEPSISDQLIAEKLVKPYKGGHRDPE
jgi:endonuclease YncB( thermonuclease family)